MSADAVEVLNRVLVILRRSFMQYLRYARPFTPPGREQAIETIHKIAEAQDALAERVFDAIVRAGGLPDSGEFPMDFTDTHDLGIDYAIREAIGYQKQDIVALEQMANSANPAPAAKALLDEALRLAREHLKLLEQLAV
jgi:bacterioferritin (cytochrome b1)